MTRPVLVRAAACLAALAATVAGSFVLPGPAHAAELDETALEVTMSTLNPSVIPPSGEVIITGEVSNVSQEAWTDLQVYIVHSAAPIGDRTDLAAAAASDPATEIGDRLALEGQFTEIGDLGPGESTPYAVSVRARDLEITGEPGVYWIGVHVLGQSAGGRDSFADGRARTFIPLMDADAPRAKVAVTVPLRQAVRRGTDDRLLDISRWRRALGPDGRLDRLLGLGSSSSGPLTWLVDPAVLDAASSLAQGNPPLDVSADGSGPGDGDGADAENPRPSASASADADPEADAESDEEDPLPRAQEAARWLDAFVAEAAGSEVRAVPYGDLDVASATLFGRQRMLRKATRLGARSGDALGVDTLPVVAPPSGFLPGRVISRLGNDTPVLLSDKALPDADTTLRTRQNGVQVVLSDSATATGGPGPNDRLDALALRQRLLAEAALRSLSETPDQPLVLSLPTDYDPGPDWRQADFFGGLDVPWLQQVDLSSVLLRSTGPVDGSLPVYPVAERRAHVPADNLRASRQLARTGATYADLLTDNDSVRGDLARTGLLASSYHVRDEAARALNLARSTSNRVQLTMSQVVVEGPGFVMMSSDSGPIGVTVVNNLEQPVTIRLEAETGSDELTIASPPVLTLGPGQRSPVRMRAESTGVGVRSVTLRATTESGAALGTSVRFNVRTSNVGLVIWVVMGAGGAIFLLAVAARIRRRLQGRSDEAEPPAGEMPARDATDDDVTEART